MKKTNMLAIGMVLAVAAAGVVVLFQGDYIYAVEASVGEIVEQSAAFDSQLVITEGIVTEWEIKEYTVTIVGPDVNETFVVKRYYLEIEDPTTSDKILVRLNYRHVDPPELDTDTFTIGETISVEGLVKDFKFESIENDLDVDLVILAKEIEKENGDIITLLTDEDIENFREHRQERLERRQARDIQNSIVEISAEVITWEIYEYNVTVTGPDDFYGSRIVVRPLLVVQNIETNELILVRVSHPRMNVTFEEDFISVGEIITIKGVIRDGELNPEKFDDIEYDLFMFGISITNSDGEELTLISRDAFIRARPPRIFRIRPNRRM